MAFLSYISVWIIDLFKVFILITIAIKLEVINNESLLLSFLIALLLFAIIFKSVHYAKELD